MTRFVPWGLVFVMGCATQQRASSEAINGWTPVQQAELHGRCVGGWLAQHVRSSAADALCTCVTPQMARAFPNSWLTDGREVTADEARTIGQIHRACAKELALAPPARGDQGDAQGTVGSDEGFAPDVAQEGTGSGGEL